MRAALKEAVLPAAEVEQALPDIHDDVKDKGPVGDILTQGDPTESCLNCCGEC